MPIEVGAAPFGEWIGRRREAEDVVTERLIESFRATLDPHLAATAANESPLGLHWCLSPAVAAMDELGADGHPALNRDMPPLPQPRRMWAGGALELLEPLRAGDRVRRTSTIAGIERKDGRSGELWFVTMAHEYRTERGVAIRERQDVVYRPAAAPRAAEASPATPPPVRGAADPGGSRQFDTSPTLLFRYSALTFNGHRIHYDQPYATGVEGYAGLVVHGPLQATLLLNLAASQAGRPPVRFEYRAVAPAIAGHPITVRSRGDGDLWTEGADGRTHMQATAVHA